MITCLSIDKVVITVIPKITYHFCPNCSGTKIPDRALFQRWSQAAMFVFQIYWRCLQQIAQMKVSIWNNAHHIEGSKVTLNIFRSPELPVSITTPNDRGVTQVVLFANDCAGAITTGFDEVERNTIWWCDALIRTETSVASARKSALNRDSSWNLGVRNELPYRGFRHVWIYEYKQWN